MLDVGLEFKKMSLSVFNKIDEEINNLFEEKTKSLKSDSQDIIKKWNRIDTGVMINGVESLFSKGSTFKSLSLESAAKQPNKSTIYSSFNEFGTSRMEPIYFVRDSFKENTDNIEQEIENIIKKVGK